MSDTSLETHIHATAESRPWTAAHVHDNPRTSVPLAALEQAFPDTWRRRSSKRLTLDVDVLAKSMAHRSSRAMETSIGRPDPVMLNRITLGTTPSAISFASTETLVESSERQQSCWFPAPSMPVRTTPRSFWTPRVQPTKHHKDRDLHADLHWEINPQNPKNWSARKQWSHTASLVAMACVFTFGSTIMTPAAHHVLVSQLHVTPVVSSLTTALYIAGFGIGPFISALGSDAFGRKATLVMCMPMYATCMLIAGLVDSISAAIVGRFFAGLFCGPAMHLVYGSISDIWTHEEKTVPLALLLTSILLGSSSGPVFGSFVVMNQDWRWTQLIVLFILAACLLPMIAVSETFKDTILRRRQGLGLRAPLDDSKMKEICAKPWLMLFTEPILSLCSIYAAFHVGTLYVIYTAHGTLLADVKAFSLSAQGLAFLSMVLGVLLGMLFVLSHDRWLYIPLVQRFKEERVTDEERTLSTARNSAHRSRLTLPRLHPQIQLEEHVNIAGPSKVHRASIFRHSLKRWSTSRSRDDRDEYWRNVRMARAAANYLNSINANKDRITPGRILVLLNQNVEYCHLCTMLEGYKLKFNRVKLAEVLVEGAVDQAPLKAPSTLSLDKDIAQNRRDAAATLESAAKTSDSEDAWSHMSSSSTMADRRKTWVPPSNVPPPEWRLWLALPLCVLTPPALFMLGWTTRSEISWAPPVLAMGVLAFTTLLAFMATTQYIIECFGSAHEAAALAGNAMVIWLVAAAFSLSAFSLLSIGPEWAMSALASAGLALGAIPLVLYKNGPTLRKRQKHKQKK